MIITSIGKEKVLTSSDVTTALGYTPVNSSDVHNVPSGGSAGQVLTKSSATSYDATWVTPSGLPSVTTADNDKVLTVVNGVWGISSVIGPTIEVTGLPGIVYTFTCDSNTRTATANSSGIAVATLNSLGTWSIYQGVELKTTITVSEVTLYTVDIAAMSRIGGRVFYDNGSNGITYQFFDSSKSTISTQTVSGLSSAYYAAKISGSGSADRWYIVDTTQYVKKKWGANNTTYGASGTAIGTGRSNTNTMVTALGSNSNYCWYWLKTTLNDVAFGGCSDWYVGSYLELEALRNSSVTSSWFSSFDIYSSSEYSSYYPWCWSYYNGHWLHEQKSKSEDYPAAIFGVRSI